MAHGSCCRGAWSPLSFFVVVCLAIAPLDASAQLVAHYPFDGNGNDATANAQHARSVGGMTYAPGLRGQAAVFDGFGSHFEVDFGPALDELTGEMTLVWWMKARPDAPLDWCIPLVKRMPWTGSQQDAEMSIHFAAILQDDGRLTFDWSEPETYVWPGYNTWASAGRHVRRVLNDGGWHMLAVSLTYASPDRPALYLDGVELEADFQFFVGYPGAAVLQSKLWIGGQPVPGASSGWVRGLMDEVQVYNRRLSPVQIAGLYESVTPVDFEPPVISGLAQDTVVEATSPAGAVLNYPAPRAWDNADGNVAVACLPESGSTFPIGDTTVACSARDSAGNTASASFVVTVRDTSPPEIGGITATPDVLWPPNHRLVPVALNVAATDAADTAPSCRVLGVISNEPEDGTGDGDAAPDWVVGTGLGLTLRAERAGSGTGRAYTVTVGCTDRFGNDATRATLVTVPKDRGRK